MYNSIISSENVFNKIYIQDNDFINYSNSYVVFEKEFVLRSTYNDNIETIFTGEFATRNNKMVNQLSAETRTIKYFEKMSSKLYILKLDIESFYPNIYTHLLSGIKNMSPYKELVEIKDYFDFLDKYNMKVCLNQTKGIMAGCFSSNISSELLMLCVDYEISKYIENLDIEYIRYVDDFTFFSDSKEQLQSIVNYVQKILNKYKLRINHSKTKISENILFIDCLDFNTINNDFNSLKDFWNNYEDFIQFKEIVKNYLQADKISELKVIFAKIVKEFKDSNIKIEKPETNRIVCFMINFILQLVFYDPTLVVNCYKVLYELFDFYKKNKITYVDLIECLSTKTNK